MCFRGMRRRRSGLKKQNFVFVFLGGHMAINSGADDTALTAVCLSKNSPAVISTSRLVLPSAMTWNETPVPRTCHAHRHTRARASCCCYGVAVLRLVVVLLLLLCCLRSLHSLVTCNVKTKKRKKKNKKKEKDEKRVFVDTGKKTYSSTRSWKTKEKKKREKNNKKNATFLFKAKKAKSFARAPQQIISLSAITG